MIEDLKRFLNALLPIADSEIQELSSICTTTSFRKREHLVSAGEQAREIFFYSSGLIRFFHFNHQGVEITSDFYFGPNIVSSYTSLLTGQPSQVYLQAMADMSFLTIRYDELQSLYDRFPAIERIGRLLAEQVAIKSEAHLFSLLNFSAEERYLELAKQHPEYIKTIPIQHLASYLGVTRETLSRIRKKVGKM